MLKETFWPILPQKCELSDEKNGSLFRISNVALRQTRTPLGQSDHGSLLAHGLQRGQSGSLGGCWLNKKLTVELLIQSLFLLHPRSLFSLSPHYLTTDYHSCLVLSVNILHLVESRKTSSPKTYWII